VVAVAATRRGPHHPAPAQPPHSRRSRLPRVVVDAAPGSAGFPAAFLQLAHPRTPLDGDRREYVVIVVRVSSDFDDGGRMRGTLEVSLHDRLVVRAPVIG